MRQNGDQVALQTTSGALDDGADMAPANDCGARSDRAPDAARAALDAAAARNRYQHLIAKADAANARGAYAMEMLYLGAAADALSAQLKAYTC